MAYDLQFEGLRHLPPQSATGTLRSRTMRRRYASLLHIGAEFDQEVAMKIESTTFGAITIDGTTYQHDVVVRLSGEVVKRKKKLNKLHDTSHVLSKDDAKFLLEKVATRSSLVRSDGQREPITGS